MGISIINPKLIKTIQKLVTPASLPWIKPMIDPYKEDKAPKQ